MTRNGLFIGLATLDLVYLGEVPKANQKINAIDGTIAAGGPASNSAVIFSRLGGTSKLLASIGQNAISKIIKEDLQLQKVEIIQLASHRLALTPVSSIIVNQFTGERAVISLNAGRNQLRIEDIAHDILDSIEIVLIDGHQLEVSAAIASQAKIKGIPVVLDGGSWKVGLEKVLPYIDYAICSADFYPPGCQRTEAVFQYLRTYKIPHIAISNGDRPIQYLTASSDKIIQISVPQVKVIDTLGAGDFLHGAFCYYIISHSCIEALTKAAEIASFACQFFGTRSFLAKI